MIIGDRKKAPMLIIGKADGGEVEEQEEHSYGEHDQVLESIAEDMLNAFHIRSKKALVSAFRAMFEALEMEPHQEIDHDEY